jgi:hypothetical protein
MVVGKSLADYPFFLLATRPGLFPCSFSHLFRWHGSSTPHHGFCLFHFTACFDSPSVLFFGVLPAGEESSFLVFGIRSPSFLDVFPARRGFLDFSLGAALWFGAW